MHILDAADVGALVDVNADLQWASEDVPNHVQFIPLGTHVNGLIWVGQGHVQDLAQLTIGTNRPGIGHDFRQRLLRVMDCEVADGGIGLERDERFTIWLASTAEGQEHGANGVLAMGSTT